LTIYSQNGWVACKAFLSHAFTFFEQQSLSFFVCFHFCFFYYVSPLGWATIKTFAQRTFSFSKADKNSLCRCCQPLLSVVLKFPYSIQLTLTWSLSLQPVSISVNLLPAYLISYMFPRLLLIFDEYPEPPFSLY